MSSAAGVRVNAAGQAAVRSEIIYRASSNIPDAREIQGQTEKILKSAPFQRSERMRRFLTFIVSKVVAGEPDAIKEYNLGIDVFDRGRDFDPRVDSVVRVEARRLRAMLVDYYRAEGLNDRVKIAVPTGRYVPELSLNQDGRREPDRGGTSDLSPSLAVLPFRDISAGKNHAHFCDGIVDQLMGVLVSTGELRVLSRTSAARFGSAQEDPGAVSRDLRVDWIIEGAVRTADGKMRVDARLVKADDGYVVWSHVYERDAAAFFTLQDEICDSITRSLHAHIPGAALNGPRPNRWSNLEAYTDYLKGRQEWSKQTPSSVRRAIRCYERAAAADARYAAPLLGLAHCYRQLGFWGVLPARLALHKSTAAALETLAVDPRCGDAHAALAAAMTLADGNWRAASIEYERAIDAAPGSASVWQMYSLLYLLPQGKLDEAIGCLARADDSDSGEPYHLFAGPWIALLAGDYDRCVTLANRSLGWHPKHLSATTALGCAYEQMGRVNEAIDLLEEATSGCEANPEIEASLGHCYATAGKPEKAAEVLQRLDSKERPSSCHAAIVHAGLGDRAAACEHLSAAAAEGSPSMIWAHLDPRLASYRTDSALKRFASELGLSRLANLIWPVLAMLDSADLIPVLDLLPVFDLLC